MRMLIAVLLLLVAACDPQPDPEYKAPADPGLPTGSFVVAEKIAPDTLIDQAGRWCALTRPEYGFEWEGVNVGEMYARPACEWSEDRHPTWADSSIQ